MEPREQFQSNSSNLTNKEINRYSRQMIIPDIGVKGQNILKNSSVLIIGAGGLGCPSGLYLTGAGVGHIGLVDYDVVEETNLHRQILHTEKNIGIKKVSSAAETLKRLNSDLKISEFCCLIDSTNALDIVKEFDIVIDASDNVATRYLINDACVLSGKPLVSGSALQMEGQLTVYNYKGGPCYRCLYPQPPPPETVNNCSDAGVFGAVPGVIGVLQALEAVKILLNHEGTLHSRLLLFDGSYTNFRNIKLRLKNKDCIICGESPKIKNLIDYVEFCGSSPNDKDKGLSILKDEERISAQELDQKIKLNEKFILLDVRSNIEYEICSLPGSINIPLPAIEQPDGFNKIKKEIMHLKNNIHDKTNLYVLCRRGNDSQKAVQLLKNKFSDESLNIQDLKGGLHSWTYTVNNNFPIY